MKRRVLSGSLFGIGFFLLAMALGLALVLAPALRKIPYDMKGDLSATVASGATFAQVKYVGQTPTLSIEHADLLVQTGIQPNAAATAGLTGDLAGRTVVWNVLQETKRTDTGAVINAAESRLALDRTSAAGANWSGQCLADEPFEECTAGNVKFAGQLYQFPFDTKRETHEFFDLNLHRAVPLEYRGTETIDGLSVYRFEQDIPEQPLEMSAAAIDTLVKAFAPGATSGKVLYHTKRTVWVEPVSGVIVGVTDEQHHTLVPDVGEPTVIFDGTFHLSPETQQRVRGQAASGRTQILAMRRYVPLGLGLLGIIALIAGAWLARRTVTPRSSAPAPTRKVDSPTVPLPR